MSSYFTTRLIMWPWLVVDGSGVDQRAQRSLASASGRGRTQRWTSSRAERILAEDSIEKTKKKPTKKVLAALGTCGLGPWRLALSGRMWREVDSHSESCSSFAAPVGFHLCSN